MNGLSGVGGKQDEIRGIKLGMIYGIRALPGRRCVYNERSQCSRREELRH